MKIAVIGGGLTGLAAAYELLKNGHEVTVFEKETYLGGLASGYKQRNWKWYLEKTYHHFFTNDATIVELIKELGIDDKIIIKRPITATLVPPSLIQGAGSQQNFLNLAAGSADKFGFFAEGARSRGFVRERDRRTLEFGRATSAAISAATSPQIFQLDSPLHLLTFPYLSPIDKMRTGALLAFLKLNPFWQPLENITAERLFKVIGGQAGWRILWEPLMQGKFGTFSNTVAASWLWARIKKRTPRLCYIEGGFQTLIDALAKAILSRGGKIYTNTAVSRITYHVSRKNNIQNSKFKIQNSIFDAVLLTVPTPIANKLIKFPSSFVAPLLKIPHLHAQTLILETKEPILKACPEQGRGVYWLNINDRSFPFLAAVAHTNFMDKKHYNDHHLTYFGNYLPAGHPYLSMTKQQLLKKFLPFIKRLSPDSKFKIHDSYLFTAPFAQPVHELHYSKRAPTIQTPIPNLYLANLDSIYPWDRGTNYAVELGQKAAEEICQ